MFGYDALYDLVLTPRTVVRKPPEVHFRDAVVVGHNGSDGEPSPMIRSLEGSVRTSVDSDWGSGGCRDSPSSYLSESNSKFDPDLVNAVLWEWPAKSVADAADEGIPAVTKGGEEDEAEAG